VEEIGRAEKNETWRSEMVEGVGKRGGRSTTRAVAGKRVNLWAGNLCPEKPVLLII
jgi:hypothetical protein